MQTLPKKSPTPATIALISFVLLAIASPIAVFSSGGFGGGLSQAPQGRDRAKFNLGKAVFQKETGISATEDANTKQTQEVRLAYLQGELPNSEQKRTNLLEFAGKLSDEQLSALEYYISIRYNVTLRKAD